MISQDETLFQISRYPLSSKSRFGINHTQWHGLFQGKASTIINGIDCYQDNGFGGLVPVREKKWQELFLKLPIIGILVRIFLAQIHYFFFCNLFYFFFTTHYTTYKTLGTIFASRYLQYILTLTITWFFVFFLHVYITLNYLQNTYSRFEKKLLLTIHTFIHAHTRTWHTHTHARTQTLQHHTRLTLVLVCSNLLICKTR